MTKRTSTAAAEFAHDVKPLWDEGGDHEGEDDQEGAEDEGRPGDHVRHQLHRLLGQNLN